MAMNDNHVKGSSAVLCSILKKGIRARILCVYS